MLIMPLGMRGFCLFLQQESFMQMRKSWPMTGTVALVVSAGLMVLVNRGWAQDDDAKEIADAVRKIAKAVGENKPDDAKKQAEELKKKKELGDVMNMFKLRTKGGLGVGAKAGAVTPDGIEAKVGALAKKKMTAPEVKNQATDLEQMADDIAAISHVGDANTPTKKDGAKDPKDWTKWMDEMRKGSQDLKKAAKAKDPNAIREAAKKVNDSCSNCHGVFRDS
jgi:cytochrome c556